MSGIFFLVVLLVLAVVIPMAIAHSKKVNQAWSAAGRELGLSYTPGGFLQSRRLTGTMHGMHVVVDTFKRSSGQNNSSTYTRYRVNFPRPLGLGIRLKREGFLSGVTKLFGSQDIQIGDPSFDRAMMIKGSNEHAIRSFLTPPRRMRIQRFMAWRHENSIDDQSVQCIKRGSISNKSSIVSTVQSMVRLAWHLTGDREDDNRLQKAMQLQNEGDPEQALEVIEATVVQAVNPGQSPSDTGRFLREPVDERLMQGRLRYMAGDRKRAHEAFQELRDADPEDEEILEWFEGTKTPAPVEDAADSSASDLSTSDKPTQPSTGVAAASTVDQMDRPAETEPPAGDAEIGQKEFCDALFGDAARSFEVSRRFEQEYQGREINWQGELLKVERNYSAFIFEDAGGAKATFKIDERPSPYYGTDNVLAVVHLPESEIEGLKHRTGQRLGFAGKLAKTDGLMRNVYIDRARLT